MELDIGTSFKVGGKKERNKEVKNKVKKSILFSFPSLLLSSFFLPFFSSVK